MRIIHKLILGFLVVSFLICLVGYFAIYISQEALKKSIGESSVILVKETLDKIDRNIYNRIERWKSYCATNPRLKEAILFSNQEFEKLDNIQEYINKKDQQWVSVPKEELAIFMKEIINTALSQELRRRMDFYEETGGYKVFGEVFVTNKYGANVAQTGKTTDYYQADEEWWQRAKEDGLYVADVGYDRSAKVYSTDIGIRIDDENGNFIGAMKVVLNMEEIINMLKETEAGLEYKTTNLELLTKEGKIIYDTEERHEIFEDIAESALFKEKEGDFFVILEAGGKEELFAHAHSKGYKDYKSLGWSLIIKHETEEIFAPVIELRNAILIILLAMILFAILLGLVISRSIAVPIAKLRAATIEIGRGNLDMPVEVKSKGEIGQLAASFKKMTEDLKKTTTSITGLKKEISERKKAEKELKQSKAYTELILKVIPSATFTVDVNRCITSWNKRAEDITGYTDEDMIGKKCTLFAKEPCEDKCGLYSNDVEKPITGRECILRRKDGQIYIISKNVDLLKDEKGNVIGGIESFEDITKRKKAEEELKRAYEDLKETQAQLIQSEKLAAIGQLAAGAAHEINNPLTAISGEAEMLFKYKDKETKAASKVIVEQARRIKTITQRLLEFSRKRELKSEVLNINDTIKNTLSLLAYQAETESIKIEKELNPDLPEILGDNNQLQEVFLNIILNALQAMKKPGKLIIRTRSEKIIEYGRRKSDMFKEGQRIVIIEFEDTGKGMDDETLKKVFDPFFTTKEKNTGLGLSICYAIIRDHNGIIEAQSKLGKGSTFFVKLPVGGGTK